MMPCRPRSVTISLSAVSGAPRHATLRSCMLSEGALLIQRLEGSRPHGRLCTLNRSERVRGDQGPAEFGGMCRFGGGMVRWNTAMGCQSRAEEIAGRAIRDR